MVRRHITSITDPQAVTDALDEYDRLGAEGFFERYAECHFGRAKRYVVTRNGRQYDSKAILAVAFGHQFRSEGPLRSYELSGGVNHAVPHLERLGFTVLDRHGAPTGPSAMLFYWRRDDYYASATNGFDFHLNRSQPRIHDLETGDSLWAVTLTHDGRYVFASELVVSGKSLNPSDYEYGPYRVWGDPDQSRFFEVDDQPSIENLLRDVLRLDSAVLAQSFQGPAGLRLLTEQDDARLHRWAADLIVLEPTVMSPNARIEALLRRDLPKAHADEAFSPDSIDDARERTLTTIVRRRGQSDFRALLINAYGGRCAISGCDAVEALEAAHIIPYRGPDTNHVSNGLLLRADLHILFDLGLLSIDVETLSVSLAPSLNGTTYMEFDGVPLRLPDDLACHPNRDALAMRDFVT